MVYMADVGRGENAPEESTFNRVAPFYVEPQSIPEGH
jgi:hypothetical protein